MGVHFYKGFVSFGIISDLQKSCKNGTKNSCVLSTHIHQMLTFYQTYFITPSLSLSSLLFPPFILLLLLLFSLFVSTHIHVMVVKWCFCKSIIPSTCISWHSTVRISFSFSFICLLIYLYQFGLLVSILFSGYIHHYHLLY